MKETIKITEYFGELETTEEHQGYHYSVGETLTIIILGSICGLRNVSQIHQWATSSRTSEFLKEHFTIKKIPCYYWMLCLIKMIKPKSLNQCFMNWVQSMLPKDGVKGLTLSFDGKTICSTEKMESYESPLHIVSAQIAELGITFGQYAVSDKSNEIPAVRELIGMLKTEGCIVIADALNCQKETARTIIKGKADYLLSVKDNQPTLKTDIEDYVHDEHLRGLMDTCETCEKNRDRVERRTAYVTDDIAWLNGRKEWESLACIGAVNTQFSSKKGTTNEWHYYISSRPLSAKELLRHARLEWSVESMHWLLDVHFGEDFCRIEDEDVQQNLNIIRKIALNTIKLFKANINSKRPVSKIMFDCLLDPDHIPALCSFVEY